MKEIDDENGVSNYIDKPVKTLRQWRWLGKGPAYIKVGSSVRYRKVDIDRWLVERTVTPLDAA